MPDIFDQVASPESGQPAPTGGDIFDQVAGSAPQASAVPSALQANQDPTTLSGGLHNIAAGLNSVSTGVVHGVLDTVGGGLHVADKVANAARGLVGAAPIQDNLTNAIDREKQKLAPLEQVNPTASAVGKGGESLVEFLMGDEALKGMGFADRLTHAAKTAKILEKSPKLLKAFQIGAEALNTGVRQGTVQAAQSLVKSGGDLGEAAAGGLTAGVVGGALHGAGGLIGEGLSAAGDAGKKVQELGDASTDAASKADVASGLADKINKNEQLLQDNYGENLASYNKRVPGTTPYKDSPYLESVKDLLNHGKQSKTAFDDVLKIGRPGSKDVNTMLQGLLTKGADAVDETAADGAGADTTTNAPSPATAQQASPELSMEDLTSQRRLYRERKAQIKGFTTEDHADRQTYQTLIDGIDKTIDKLATDSGKPEVAEEYAALRDNYREHVNAFKDPVVKAITNPDGSIDDAAKAFIGVVRQSGLPQGSKVQQSLNTLQKVLDPLGKDEDKPLKQFGQQVFGTLLKEAGEGKDFNASKFMDTWSKIDGPTQKRLFDVSPGAQTDVAKMVQDARDVANVQRLTRMGLLGAAGATAGHSMMAIHPEAGLGVLGLLGLVNEKAGMQAGRNALDFIANHPWTWKTFRGLGAAAENPGVQKAAGAAEPVVAHEAAEAVTK